MRMSKEEEDTEIHYLAGHESQEDPCIPIISTANINSVQI